MIKTKRIFTIVLAVAMIICTVFSTVIPASAATHSNGTQTRTITVKTKANYFIPGSESITISQSKGVCVKETYNIFTRRTSTSSSKQYGTWDIVVRATDGSHTYSKSLTGGSIKLNLKPNKTYIITVSWNYQAENFKEICNGNFVTFPTWKVKSTWKVSKYY